MFSNIVSSRLFSVNGVNILQNSNGFINMTSIYWLNKTMTALIKDLFFKEKLVN